MNNKKKHNKFSRDENVKIISSWFLKTEIRKLKIIKYIS